MKIHSPAKGYTGTDVYGATEIKFQDGVAEFDGELPDGVRQYMLGAGYGIDAEATEPEAAPEPPDPRNLSDGTLGTPLRDAAVDPRPEDFLAPTNAGEANPHGPEVVSPEIHASQGVRPVKAGDVHVDDPAAQEKAEQAHTTTVLAEGTEGAIEPEPERDPDPFDPAKHSVAEVTAYLDGLDASDKEAHDAEVARVLEAERNGKNRTTLVGTATGDGQPPSDPGTENADNQPDANPAA